MENERGFHHPRSQGHDHNRGGSVGGEGRGEGGKSAHEPTNHGGHTHEMAKRHEHDARVEGFRAVHAGGGQQAHEKILHETHKLHQEPGRHISHGDKRGESAHRGNGE